MAGATDTRTNLTQAAQDLAGNNVSLSAFADSNITEDWTIGPDGEFDGDPEEPRFAVLVFYCIHVRNFLAATFFAGGTLHLGPTYCTVLCRL